jgi:hypothetical protein
VLKDLRALGGRLEELLGILETPKEETAYALEEAAPFDDVLAGIFWRANFGQADEVGNGTSLIGVVSFV